MAPGARERLRALLEGEVPDRVPIDFAGTPQTGVNIYAYERLKEKLGVDSPTEFLSRRAMIARPHPDVLDRFNVDFTLIVPPEGGHEGVRPYRPEEDDGEQEFTDTWGVHWRKPPRGHYYVVRNPLGELDLTIKEVEEYPWPEPSRAGLEELRDEVKKLRETSERALVLSLPSRLFAQGQRLTGFANWLLFLAKEPRLAEALLEGIVEHNLARARVLLKAVGDLVDIVAFADDLGMQESTIISPEMYRRLIKPYQERFFSEVRSLTGAALFFHSCGSVAPFIEDFIEMGLDILNPVQTSARGMEPESLKERFGGRIVFWGGIDSQRVLPFGTPQEVREEVERKLKQLGPVGYIPYSIHNIQPEVPPENILAMMEAIAEFGNYN